MGARVKVSIKSQIAEVDRELGQRRQVYPRLVSNRTMRESVAELQIKHMEAVRETLVWLQDNERLIKQRLAN